MSIAAFTDEKLPLNGLELKHILMSRLIPEMTGRWALGIFFFFQFYFRKTAKIAPKGLFTQRFDS